MQDDCKQCKLPEVLSGEISLSLREWDFLQKIRFWVLLYGKITGWLSDKLFAVSKLALIVMVIPITADVLMRVLLHKSLPGIIETEEILLLVIVFAGLAWADYNGGHIKVDLVYHYFPRWLKTDLVFFHTTLMGTYSAILTYFLFEAGFEKIGGAEVTPDFGLPYWPWFFLAGAGALMLCLCIFKQTLDAVLDILEHRQFIGFIVFTALAFALIYLPFQLENTAMSRDIGLVGGLAVAALLLMLLLRMPIGFAMGIVGVLGLIVVMPTPTVALSYMATAPINTTMSFMMTVVPMFMLMGELALYSGISAEMFNTASIWLGRFPGGVAVAGVMGCAGFAAICGESLPTAMTMTSVALPEMKKRGYNEGLGCAALASGGTLGILIPPSLGFIMYAVITEESVGRLFLAGIIPGLLLTLFFCGMLIFISLRWPHLAPRGDRHSMKEKIFSLVGIVPMLLLVILILGGILRGFFSPTEAGAVGSSGTLLYALVRRQLSLADFMHAVRNTAAITARLMLIIIGVNLLGYFLAVTGLPQRLADWTLAVASNRYIVFAAIVLLYIVLGCLMNVLPMMFFTLPAIFPTVQAMGFDPIWFGVITVILMEMGQITPPMGLVVFAVAGMPNTPSMGQIFKYIFPFVLAMLFLIILLTIFPSIALFLPSLLM